MRRRFGWALATALGLLVLPSATEAAAGTAATERVSVGRDASQAEGYSFWPAISGGGRYVAFASTASNLVPGDTNGMADLFVRDRVTGAVERVNVASDGSQANGDSYHPVISADGRYVAFTSSATNLVPGDTNGTYDVFLHDRVTGTTTRVSVHSNGAQAAEDSEDIQPSISSDGRYVAFVSRAALVPQDTNDTWDAYVHDRVTGSTTLVSVHGNELPARRRSTQTAISGNGRYVAFSSLASLVPGDTNGSATDVYVRDLVAGTTRRVSVGNHGRQADDYSFDPAISADGRYVAFRSWATNLVPGDTDAVGTEHGGADVFVRDRVARTTARVSVATDGRQADVAAFGAPAISADGRYVVFSSAATNLVACDTNDSSDVFVRDRVAGTTRRVTVATDGRQPDSSSAEPSISGDGRYVVFTSDATNLVPEDTNNSDDVFLRDRRG